MNITYVNKLSMIKKIDVNKILNFMDNYNKIIIFDTETTGVDFENNEIIEFGSICFEKDLMNNIYMYFDDILVKPEKINFIPKEITELTGFTSERIFNDGLSIENFIKILNKIFNSEKILIIGFNLNFDLNFLKNYINIDNYDYLDLYSVFKDIKSYPNRLCDALDFYNITEANNTHLAIDDAFATLKVFEKMIDNKTDLKLYINIFGYNPKYYDSLVKIPGVTYKAQSYDRFKLGYKFNYLYED